MTKVHNYERPLESVGHELPRVYFSAGSAALHDAQDWMLHRLSYYLGYVIPSSCLREPAVGSHHQQDGRTYREHWTPSPMHVYPPHTDPFPFRGMSAWGALPRPPTSPLCRPALLAREIDPGCSCARNHPLVAEVFSMALPVPPKSA